MLSLFLCIYDDDDVLAITSPISDSLIIQTGIELFDQTNEWRSWDGSLEGFQSEDRFSYEIKKERADKVRSRGGDRGGDRGGGRGGGGERGGGRGGGGDLMSSFGAADGGWGEDL
jgi:hypothetical protein